MEQAKWTKAAPIPTRTANSVWFITVGLLTVAPAIAVTVAWFILIGHAFMALLDFLAANPAGAVPH